MSLFYVPYSITYNWFPKRKNEHSFAQDAHLLQETLENENEKRMYYTGENVS